MLKQEKHMIATARGLAHTILSITRAGLDRAHVARTLWETCAIPAIIYASEAFCVWKSVIAELEKIQSRVGKFILQVPSSSSNAVTWTDAGMLPMKFRLPM